MEQAIGHDQGGHGGPRAPGAPLSRAGSARAFDARRFGRFLRFELLTRPLDFLLPLAVPAALLVLLGTFGLLRGAPSTEFPTWLYPLGLLLGLGSAVSAHRADREPATAAFHVTLPASHPEKFAARWVLTFGLSYVANWLLLPVLFSGFGLVALARTGHFPLEASLAPSELLRGLTGYLPVHAIFFLGGAVFRGNVFLKTVVSVAAYALALCVPVSLLAYWGLGENAWLKVFAFAFDVGPRAAIDSVGAGVDVGLPLVRAAWSVVLPLFLYAAAYFRTVEHEVR